MRILVIAQSRSGSTGFAAWLKSETNEQVMVDPFNPYSNTEEELQQQMDWLNSNNGLILKFVDNMFLKSSYPELNDVNNLISKFDKVIGLTREDDEACANSRMIGHLSDDWRGSSKNTEVSLANLDEAATKELFNLYVDQAKANKEYIRNLPIFKITYENIYIEKNIDELIEYLGFEPKNLDYLFENKNITYNWNF